MDEYNQKMLTKFKIQNFKDLSFEQLNFLFLTAISDFKNGTLKLEDLSLFALQLAISPEKNDSFELSKLKEIIYYCSEINYYLRQIPEVDKNGMNTISFLLETMNYYQEHKDLLKHYSLI